MPRPPRRRRRRAVLAGLALFAAAIGVFAVLYETAGSHEVSLSSALQQFRHSVRHLGSGAAPGRPAEGVYEYTGSGTESLSLPPKTQYEGPGIPATVVDGRHGCWTLRQDFSDNHWQFTTFCPSGRDVMEAARGGWYRWDFVATTVSDESTLYCRPFEVAFPASARPGQTYRFSCRGGNHPLDLGPVTLAGTTRYLGTVRVRIGHESVEAVHMSEVGSFSGGQTGTETVDTLYDRANGLPLEATWSEHVNTRTPVGVSTLSAVGRFRLTSLSARS